MEKLETLRNIVHDEEKEKVEAEDVDKKTGPLGVRSDDQTQVLEIPLDRIRGNEDFRDPFQEMGRVSGQIRQIGRRNISDTIDDRISEKEKEDAHVMNLNLGLHVDGVRLVREAIHLREDVT